MGPPTLRASVLVLLLLQPGWRMLAGQCIPDDDLIEAMECCQLERYIPKDIAEKCIQQVRTVDSPDRTDTRNSMIVYEELLVGDDGHLVDAYLVMRMSGLDTNLSHHGLRSDMLEGRVQPRCLLNCAFNAMGLITANGAVDAEKFMPYIATFDESLRTVVTSAVLTCANSTDDIMRDIQDWKSSCNAFPLMFDVCVAQYSLEHCPAERFTLSPVCNLVKSGATVC